MKKLVLAAARTVSANVLNAAPSPPSSAAQTTATAAASRCSTTAEGSPAEEKPAKGSTTTSRMTVNWNGNGADKGFKFAFDGRYLLEDVHLSVGGDDQYRLEYSRDDLNCLPYSRSSRAMANSGAAWTP